MYELALFAGAGGGLLASKWLLGWRTVCYVERDPYCVDVLAARMRDGLLDIAPVWDDANTFDGRPWRGIVDVVSAGFPCQPFSVAGQRRAGDDERNGWPATIRIIREIRPRFALLENVSGLLAGSHSYFGQILAELADGGMDAVWGVRSAASVGAPHIRKRLFVLAYANGAQWGQVAEGNQPNGANTGWGQGPTGAGVCSEDGRDGDVARASAHTYRQADGQQHGYEEAGSDRHPAISHVQDALRRGWSAGLEQPRLGYEPTPDGTNSLLPIAKSERLPHGGQTRSTPGTDEAHGPMAQSRFKRRGRAWWATEPRVGRVAYGVAHRLDRIAAIGNGQVPQVVAEVWAQLMGFVNE